MVKLANFIIMVEIYGWNYIFIIYPVCKLYFSQRGKTIGKRIHHKFSLTRPKEYYFYGYAYQNPYL
jgi:hypothetical protein